MGKPGTHQGYSSKSIPVPPGWEAVFSPFYYAANRQQKTVIKRLLPTFQTILVFSFGHTTYIHPAGAQLLTIENSMVIGPLKKTLEYHLPPGSEILVANFKADAFYRFFGKALKPYRELLLHPDELTPAHCFATLWQELKTLPVVEQRVAKLLDFAGTYLREREIAAEYIINSKVPESLNPVKLIAHQNQQSARTIQLQYQKYLGYSAKEINRHQRFQKAVVLIQQQITTNTIDWFEVIHQCGYYDQSHLIHDFNFYMDISPVQFLKLQEDICIAAG